jgi:hypothetical protein
VDKRKPRQSGGARVTFNKCRWLKDLAVLIVPLATLTALATLLALLATLAGLLARLLLAATLLLSGLTGLRIVLLLLVTVGVLVLLRHVLLLGGFRPTRPACCRGRSFLRRVEGHLAAQLPRMRGAGTYASIRFKREARQTCL